MELFELLPQRLKSYGQGGQDELVEVREWYEQRKREQLAQSAASSSEDLDDGLLDEDPSPRSEDALSGNLAGHTREAYGEDNEFYPEDGVQESPSHHKQRFDLEGGHRGHEVPSQMDVELLNYKDAEYIGEIFLGAP